MIKDEGEREASHIELLAPQHWLHPGQYHPTAPALESAMCLASHLGN